MCSLKDCCRNDWPALKRRERNASEISGNQRIRTFEIPIIRAHDKGEVKLRVRGDVCGGAAILPRRGHMRDVFRESAQQPVGIAGERVTHRIRLEQAAETAQIVDVFRCRRADVGSCLRGNGDQSFLAQLDQGAPDGGLAHAKRSG